MLTPNKPSNETCWMQTYTGRVFYPLEPKVEDIHIEDIAGALSKMCRFAGHCAKFYSVAEHCVHLADIAPKKLKLAALLHDASEAYLVDIPRPIKPFLPGYYEIEDRLMKVVAQRFGIMWPLPAEVKRLDTAILSDERNQNMANMDVEPLLWGNTLPPLGIELEFWVPSVAQHFFLEKFKELGGS